MVDLQAPKRDKKRPHHHEDDAQARAAAKEQRRAREEAKKAADQRKEKAAQSAPKEEPAQAAEEKAPEKSRRRRRKAKAKPEPVQAAPVVQVSQPEPQVQQPARRRKLTRPGSRMDTGDAMPRTDFSRPNPLAGDHIMDATARLLAPRKPLNMQDSPLSHRSAPRSRRKERRGEKEPRVEAVQTKEKAKAKSAPPAAKKKEEPVSGKKKSARPDRAGTAAQRADRAHALQPGEGLHRAEEPDEALLLGQLKKSLNINITGGYQNGLSSHVSAEADHRRRGGQGGQIR